MKPRSLTLLVLILLAVVPLTWQSQLHSQEKPVREPDVIYVPTPQEVVDKMLEMAYVRPGEVVYDLGCGDGRIPVTDAKKYGYKAWGFELNPGRDKDYLDNVTE